MSATNTVALVGRTTYSVHQHLAEQGQTTQIQAISLIQAMISEVNGKLANTGLSATDRLAMVQRREKLEAQLTGLQKQYGIVYKNDPSSSRSAAPELTLQQYSEETLRQNLYYIVDAIKTIEMTLADPKKRPATPQLVEELERKKATLVKKREHLEGQLKSLPVAPPAAKPVSHVSIHLGGLFEVAAQIRAANPLTNAALLKMQKGKLEFFLKQLINGEDKLMETFNALPSFLRQQIYFYVWLARLNEHNQTISIEDAMGNDPRMLLEITAPFLHSKGRNLLEQFIAFLEMRFQLETLKEAKTDDGMIRKQVELIQTEQEVAFRRLVMTPGVTHRQLRKIHSLLDPAVKSKLPSELTPPYYGRGVQHTLYEDWGAQVTSKGVRFRLFAPNAKDVSVMITDKGKDKHPYPMKKNKAGIWEVHIDRLPVGTTYDYLLTTQAGKGVRKMDPLSFACQKKQVGSTDGAQAFVLESVVCDLNKYKWNDAAWLAARAANAKKLHPLIYEVHPTSWIREKGKPLNYRVLAPLLAKHCKEMGFTHVELMAILDHADEKTWGYLATGYFAPNHRMGTPEDFQFFVDVLHQNGIGVIIDWVPGHFSDDRFGLREFDGTNLYEHADQRRSHNVGWGAFNFNFERKEVRDLLLSSALFWAKKYHIDGLRIDGVESMISLKFGKKPTEPWLPNRKGGSANLEAILFIKDLNTLIHAECPGVVTIAEDSSEELGRTRSPREKGFGFDYRWGFKWMHALLSHYLELPRDDRPFWRIADEALHTDAEEVSVRTFSHDEVSTIKQSLPLKMNEMTHTDTGLKPDVWRQFADARLFLAQMMLLPGAKLLFMGSEFAQLKKFGGEDGLLVEMLQKDPNRSTVQWELMGKPYHKEMLKFTKDLNQFYLKYPALWGNDKVVSIHNDPTNALISFHRKDSKGNQLACVQNFSPNYIEGYIVPFHSDLGRELIAMKEVFNSDDLAYGGSGKINTSVEIVKDPVTAKVKGFKIKLAPMATMVFEEIFK